MENFIVIYRYPYKGKFDKLSKKYKISDERDIAYAMAEFLEIVDGSMLFSGIDHKGLEDYILENKGKNLKETLSNIKTKEVSSFSNYEELKDVAFSYSIHLSLKEHGESAFPKKEEIKKELESTSFPEKKGIGIMLRYDDLVIIKKLSYEDVEDYMVAGIISGISDSITNKLYQFLGYPEINKKRKSLKNLIDALGKINGVGLERRYNTYKAIMENGFYPYATLEMLAKKYKDLKPKKPKGRLPK